MRRRNGQALSPDKVTMGLRLWSGRTLASGVFVKEGPVIAAGLAIPDKVRDLQIKPYRKAKKEPGFRFYQLYDKVYREDVLLRAWVLAKANDGAAGVDGASFEDIESRGLLEWLNGLRKDLHDKTYQPQPVRRVMIPKPGG